MKILVAMQSSTEDIYRKGEALLKSMYGETIRRKNLPVDVISYVGDDGPTRIENDTLFVKCDNKMSMEKHRALYEYFKSRPEYDVIIKTNVSTVLNLELLCIFSESVWFDRNNMYCSCMMYDNRLSDMFKSVSGNASGNVSTVFPIGFFLMAHRNVWNGCLSVYNKAYSKAYGHTIQNDSDFRDYERVINDDEALSFMLIMSGKKELKVMDYLKITPDEMEHTGFSKDFNEMHSTACMRCKVVTDSPDNDRIRVLYEPNIMKMANLIYSGHDVSYNELMTFTNNIGWRVIG